jgi:transcriptional regulator with PAS, ATPase and Fis domain
MEKHQWIHEAPIAISVADAQGRILEMNRKSIDTFAADGGAELIGKSLMDCHPEPARSKLQELLDKPRGNLYTIEKAGVKKLICQIPWYREGIFSGLVELAIELPADMPHFVRD